MRLGKVCCFDLWYLASYAKDLELIVCYACGIEDRDTPYIVLDQPLCHHCHLDMMRGLDHLDRVVEKERSALEALKWLNIKENNHENK